MSTYSKVKLSGSTDGRGILVTATAIGSGTTIHTADSTAMDLVTLFASNIDTATSYTLTIGWGGTTSPDDLITLAIPAASGLVLVTADLLIQNSLVLKAATNTGSKVSIFGYVNRIS